MKPFDCYCTYLQVFESEVHNLVSESGQYRDAIEVAVLVDPLNIDYLTELALIELNLNINLSNVCVLPGFDGGNMYFKCLVLFKVNYTYLVDLEAAA